MKKLLTLAEAAERLHIPEATLRHWRYKQKGPQGFRVGRRVMYFATEIDAWLETQAETARQGKA